VDDHEPNGHDAAVLHDVEREMEHARARETAQITFPLILSQRTSKRCHAVARGHTASCTGVSVGMPLYCEHRDQREETNS